MKGWRRTTIAEAAIGDWHVRESYLSNGQVTLSQIDAIGEHGWDDRKRILKLNRGGIAGVRQVDATETALTWDERGRGPGPLRRSPDSVRVGDTVTRGWGTLSPVECLIVSVLEVRNAERGWMRYDARVYNPRADRLESVSWHPGEVYDFGRP